MEKEGAVYPMAVAMDFALEMMRFMSVYVNRSVSDPVQVLVVTAIVTPNK